MCVCMCVCVCVLHISWLWTILKKKDSSQLRGKMVIRMSWLQTSPVKNWGFGINIEENFIKAWRQPLFLKVHRKLPVRNVPRRWRCWFWMLLVDHRLPNVIKWKIKCQAELCWWLLSATSGSSRFVPFQQPKEGLEYRAGVFWRGGELEDEAVVKTLVYNVICLAHKTWVLCLPF
jgi:hypothetical protein